MDIQAALQWASQRRNGVLITIRGDGRPQSSDVSYHVADRVIVVSVTDGRAKTKNLRRDPRAVFHITEPSSWSYVSFDGMVELSPVATQPDDDTVEGLVEYYRNVAGDEHPDWDEYRQAMVDEGRLLLRFTPTSAVGQIHT